MEYKKICEIAEVQSGLVLSRKESRLSCEHPIKYLNLNLRSINDDGCIDKGSLNEYLAKEKLEERFITKKDDVIVRLFSPFIPALITEAFSGLVVPSQFAIIRLLDGATVLPEFLYGYLSHRHLLESLAVRESGQISSGMKISTISEIKIPLLTLDKQTVVIAYREMHMQQKQLYRELIQQYDFKMDAVIENTIGGK